jgi:hypothetical protein
MNTPAQIIILPVPVPVAGSPKWARGEKGDRYRRHPATKTTNWGERDFVRRQADRLQQVEEMHDRAKRHLETYRRDIDAAIGVARLVLKAA